MSALRSAQIRIRTEHLILSSDSPVWLTSYNDELHWLTDLADKRDWNIRLQQYFDHYLKGAPPAEWMVKGVPATEKGESLALKLVTKEGGH